jgi:zinc transporter ZupT
VGHPADVLTVLLAWLAALAVCGAALLFGQTARTARRRRRRRRGARLGLFLSLSGPWLAVLSAVTVGAVTGAWLAAAAVAASGAVVLAVAGLALTPH